MNVAKTGTTKKRSKQSFDASVSSSSSPAAATFSLGGAYCSFPSSRVWRLVRGECSGGASGAEIRTTAEAVFVINKASEIFLERLTEDAYAVSMSERKKFVSYNHLSSTVNKWKRYEFLSDFVPEKLSAEEALKTRSLVES
ncbi:hypothetical protein HPP92_012296 [Vanilla planifolia]|uniref:Transcription factor CBF/NF-Y/archaeal histone domain-containing protein n=1 Tax=Vanilla planifolia TaxID=51239 RepID=A0A835UXE6_VANPL|nr:hypothetical protein HPP92_012296 [Vanilla planifolia]